MKLTQEFVLVSAKVNKKLPGIEAGSFEISYTLNKTIMYINIGTLRVVYRKTDKLQPQFCIIPYIRDVDLYNCKFKHFARNEVENFQFS